MRPRPGISELYAAVLMVGVTISFGGFVAASAIAHFGSASQSSALASSLQDQSVGKQVSLVYGTVPNPGSGGCRTLYGGFAEGTGYVLVLFNFGTTAFTPAQILLNGTLLSGGPYAALPPGQMAAYSLTLSCAHPSGQTFFLIDSVGDVVQVGT